MLKRLAFLPLLVLTTAAALGQAAPKPPQWDRLDFLLGTWDGDGTGIWGDFKSEVTHERILDDYFLLGRLHAVYQPQEKNPDGEIHDNWDIYGFDRDRDRWVMRQFHTEGFVNTYVLDEAASSDTVLVFVTERIENIATLMGAGWRARMTLKVTGHDEYVEVFELAGPEQDFKLAVETKFRRRAGSGPSSKNF